VESSNFEAGRRLQDDMNSRYAELASTLDQFRLDHGEFCGVRRMRAGKLLYFTTMG